MLRLGQETARGQPTTTLTTADFKDHFEDLSAQRYEREPHEIEAAKDLRMKESAQEANIMVNEMVEEEIDDAIKEAKDSLPGEDGVRISYIKLVADPAMKQEIVRVVQHMFKKRSRGMDPIPENRPDMSYI